MAGSKESAKKMVATLKAKLGEEGYKNLVRDRGRKGGLSPKTKPSGFAANRELASTAGYKGGKASRRRKAQ